MVLVQLCWEVWGRGGLATCIGSIVIGSIGSGETESHEVESAVVEAAWIAVSSATSEPNDRHWGAVSWRFDSVSESGESIKRDLSLDLFQPIYLHCPNRSSLPLLRYRGKELSCFL